jgi:3-oxoadipate CoA-transferase alpha subunit
MLDKRVPGLEQAVAGMFDGATIMVSGFGETGVPTQLCEAMVGLGLRDLTVISNNAGYGRGGLAALMATGAVRRIVCSCPISPGSLVFEELYAAGRIELELVPQGTFSERIRAGAAGVGGFFVRTAAGTELAEGKEQREIDGQLHVLEKPLKADFALVKARHGDRWGNLDYHSAARSLGPVMASAARTTIAQVQRIVELGDIHPEHVITPGIFVHRVVEES